MANLQAHPLACVAALAVQKVIVEEDLLSRAVENGELMSTLLRQGLQAEGAISKPFCFDIRGRGAFWGIEFDLHVPEAANMDSKGESFAMAVQARCFENGLIVMGMTSGTNIEGTKGDHIILGPAYNATREEIEQIVGILVRSVEEVLREWQT